MYTEYLDYPTAVQWVAWPCQRQQHVGSSKPSLTHKWQDHEHTDSF